MRTLSTLQVPPVSPPVPPPVPVPQLLQVLVPGGQSLVLQALLQVLPQVFPVGPGPVTVPVLRQLVGWQVILLPPFT